MNNRGLFLIAALLMATMACQTIMNPVTNSEDLEPEDLLEPVATNFVEELDPDSLFEDEGDEPSQVTEEDGSSDSGQVLLQDDFSNPSSGWEVGEFDSGSVGYTSDAYFVVSLGDSDMMWGLAFQQFDDVVIEVEATQVRAPSNDNNGYGVMCRVQDNDDGYMLRVSGDGFYAIQKWSNDELVALVDWTTSDAINLGNATNQIRATCDGSTFSLEVNGQLLATTEDSEFASGDLALTATSFEEDPTEVQFDNLVVTAP